MRYRIIKNGFDKYVVQYFIPQIFDLESKEPLLEVYMLGWKPLYKNDNNIHAGHNSFETYKEAKNFLDIKKLEEEEGNKRSDEFLKKQISIPEIIYEDPEEEKFVIPSDVEITGSEPKEIENNKTGKLIDKILKEIRKTQIEKATAEELYEFAKRYTSEIEYTTIACEKLRDHFLDEQERLYKESNRPWWKKLFGG